MKKIISICLCLVLVCSVFIGCAKQETYQSDIVLITNGGTIKDDGYNQSAWEGISAYADDNGMSCRYYQPALADGKLTTEIVNKYVDLAAKNGAKFVVLPGNEFAVITYEIASTYPDVNFILVDAIPHSADTNTDSFMKNVMSISFDSSQGGFLAGYLAVINGNTELGYLGEYKSRNSASYGAGFVQGAAYAADSLGIPVTVDWADYDSPFVDYNYNFSVKACYQKIEDVEEKTFTVKVVDGIGSGTYTEGSNVTITANTAPEGKTFDHWEVKSDTDGVKDKKVNISSKTKSSMNLLVEKCDCTITAIYKDIENDYKTVTVMDAENKNAIAEYSVELENGVSVKAPAAPENLVFDHWETTADLGETDLTSKEIRVDVKDSDIVLTPIYKAPDSPSFNVTVQTGEGGDGESTGSGSYVAGDVVEIAAAIPQEGYMFSHWENVDSYGDGTGISMANEYYWNTTFEMVDRYAAVCETMFNKGINTIFDGGCSIASAYTAKWNFDFEENVISAGAKNKDAYSTIINNYGEAVKDALADYKGGTVVAANCSTDGLYATYVSPEENDDIQAKYDAVYKALADGQIQLVPVQNGAGYDFCKLFNEQKASKCLTLNGWFIETQSAE